MQADALILTSAGTVLITMGIVSISMSKNLLKTIMSFQVVLFGANLALFAAGLNAESRLSLDTFVLLSLTVGAAVESVGLAIVLTVHKKYGTLDPSKVRKLRH